MENWESSINDSMVLGETTRRAALSRQFPRKQLEFREPSGSLVSFHAPRIKASRNAFLLVEHGLCPAWKRAKYPSSGIHRLKPI